MFLIRYVMSRILVFWLSIAILVVGWFRDPRLVNTGFGAGESMVRNITRIDGSGKAETVALHVLHTGDLVVIAVVMLVVTLVLTLLRNLLLGSGGRRMTVVRALAQVVVLLVLAYVALAVVWWYDAPLVNAWLDASRALMGRVAAWIDPGGQLDLVFRALGLARHLVVACVMLALALVWETSKALGRAARALVSGRSTVRIEHP